MPKLISYAQNFEDIMLWRALKGVSHGGYVDIGAQSPTIDSVSLLFYQHGWRGVHVEPTDAYAQQLREERADEVVIQAAVSEKAGTLRFYDIKNTGLSTTNASIAETHRRSGFKVSETVVPTITLDDVFENLPFAEIHWLKIDVEGAEADVLKGWRNSPKRPWVLVIESTLPLSTEESHQRWESTVLEKGYRFVYFDGLNRFYLAHGKEELLSAFASGPNIFDDFSLSPNSTFCAEVNIQYRALEDRMERESERQRQELEIQRHAQSEAAARESQLREAAAAVNAELLSERQRWAETEAKQQRVKQAMEQELDAAYVKSEEASHSAHRWWVAAEELRAEVALLRSSHSWRATRPLRSARRMISTLIARTKRMIRRLARPVLVWGMKRVLARPALKAKFSPQATANGRIYARLRALATSEGLLDVENRPLEPLFAVTTGSGVASPLPRRAANVLRDLKIAMAEKDR